MLRIYKWLKIEVERVFPAVIFFALAFDLIHFTERLMRQPGQHSYYTYMGLTIAALVIGKILIIVDSFPFINAFPNKPLIYNITWKFFIYSFFILLTRIFESFFHLMREFKSLPLVWTHLQAKLASPIFWATQMWLFVLFIVYVVVSEFEHVITRKKVLEMLFGE